MDQTQQLAQLHAYTYEKMSHDHTGHDMAHIERVVKMARTLNENSVATASSSKQLNFIT